MNKYVVVRGDTAIDTFAALDLAQKYVKDWPGQGLRVMERGLSGTLYPFETFDHADGGMSSLLGNTTLPRQF
jgi:hypothetical protein